MKTGIACLGLIIFAFNFVMGQSVNDHQVQYKNKPIVEMTLNGKKTWVLLDTGSSISILNANENAQDEYEYIAFEDRNGALTVPGFGSQNNELLYARRVDLRFGETKLKRQFYAFDFSTVVESIKSRTGKEITAIIGTEIMKSYGFVIDMGNSTVYMSSKKNREIVASQ